MIYYFFKMIIRTIIIITIFSNIGNYTGVYSTPLLDRLFMLEIENIDEFNLTCQHAAYVYIANGLYNNDYQCENVNDEEKNPKSSCNVCKIVKNQLWKSQKKLQNNSDRFKTKNDRISEVNKLIFRLQRVFNHCPKNIDGSDFFKRVWMFFRNFSSWVNKLPDDTGERELRIEAMNIIQYGILNQLWLQTDYDMSFQNRLTTTDVPGSEWSEEVCGFTMITFTSQIDEEKSAYTSHKVPEGLFKNFMFKDLPFKPLSFKILTVKINLFKNLTFKRLPVFYVQTFAVQDFEEIDDTSLVDWLPPTYIPDTILNTYYNCITTFDSLTKPTEIIESQLYEKHMEEMTYIDGTYLTNVHKVLLPPIHVYGTILLLLKPGEAEKFLKIGVLTQKMYIIDIMYKALVNAFDFMNIYFDKLKISKLSLDDLNYVYTKPIYELNNDEYIKLKLFMIVYKNAISTVEALNKIPDDRSEKTKEFEENYLFFVKKVAAKWAHICAGSAIPVEVNNDLTTKVRNNYRDQLTTQTGKKYLIRVSMYGYISAALSNEPEDFCQALSLFMEKNYKTKLLSEINFWMTIIRNIASIMMNDLYYYLIMQNERSNFSLTEDKINEIKNNREQHDSIFKYRMDRYNDDKELMDKRYLKRTISNTVLSKHFDGHEEDIH